MINAPQRGLKNKNILIAGGTGLVGTHLVKAAHERGAGIRATFFSRKPFFLADKYCYFNFTESEDCLKAARNMDYVVICAAQKAGAKVMKEDPASLISPNLAINSGLLEACRVNKVKKTVLISSSTVYQEANYPIAEAELDLNKPPYELYFGVGWLNRYMEQLAGFYRSRYGMDIVIARPASIYGPHDRFEEGVSNVIPALIRRAVEKENPFIVWGDGSQVRDFVYAQDLADDLLDMLEGYRADSPLNIGSGHPISIKEAVGVILDACGYGVTPIYDRTKPVAIPYRVLDTKKFEFIFGKKKRTPFIEGIRNTSDWYKGLLKGQLNG